MADTTIQQLSDAIAAAIFELNEQERRIAVSLYDLLAGGDPVAITELAERSRIEESVVRDPIERWPGIFRDDDGRVVGFWGLAIPEMAHSFHAEGGKPMHAWCALDPFLIVPVIGRSARVASIDPVAGDEITMTVTPHGVEELSPASAVVSFVVPDKLFDHDVIQTFCHYVLNFASPDSAESWAADREGIVLLPVNEAFEVGLRAWSQLHD